MSPNFGKLWNDLLEQFHLLETEKKDAPVEPPVIFNQGPQKNEQITELSEAEKLDKLSKSILEISKNPNTGPNKEF